MTDCFVSPEGRQLQSAEDWLFGMATVELSAIARWELEQMLRLRPLAARERELYLLFCSIIPSYEDKEVRKILNRWLKPCQLSWRKQKEG